MGGTAGFAVVVFGGLGGVVAYLAGVVGLREGRRLRRVGVPVRALVRERVPAPEDRGSPPRPLLQFETEDGRVVEVFSPVPSTPRHPLPDGGYVALRYDPADPRQVLVEGRERRPLEYGFIALGLSMVLIALVLAVVVL
ncbi:DUF3592 domain-containing protein [Streptomyces sp. SP17BM10]|uniref:DUF3592 domain-containing protein n=1 Tax=Streptomyces sp. SP17BM10 TaxID=3002530 RepID=UPI002E7980E1|nr:DUF3592 domain-containing protein [Streptomyces sp. SP17BM10]MEE1788544.1 DUF3592 domain-containing protein [Streptomyces sp. SP17BM10]